MVNNTSKIERMREKEKPSKGEGFCHFITIKLQLNLRYIF